MSNCKLLAATALSLGLFLPSAFGAASASHQTHRVAPVAYPAPQPIAPMQAHRGPLPALPNVTFVPPRPMTVVRQAYEFAARHPEVLQYVPCYCGCERVGHNGNHDCFVKSRTSTGKVTAWDPHGIGCQICLDVASDAMTLFNAGRSVSQIRAAIDQKFARHFPSSTPTARP